MKELSRQVGFSQLEDYEFFRGAANGIYIHADLLRAKLCYRFKWTEDEYNKTSLDFIIKCMIYLEERDRKKSKK